MQKERCAVDNKNCSIKRETDEKDILKQFQLSSMPVTESTTKVIEKHRQVFSKNRFDIGLLDNFKHRIETMDNPPILSKPYRIPRSVEQEVEEKIEELLKHGIIVECSSSWNSPVVPIRKKNGDLRLCVDFRKINAVTMKKNFFTPDLQQIGDCLKGAKYFSTLDLCQGYYQILLDERDQIKSAFTTKSGQYCFTRMPFGLTGAPATFQRAMTQVMRNANWKNCVVFMDDILVFGETIEQHDQNLDIVLEALETNGLKVLPTKCFLLKEEVSFLGHVIDKFGIRTDPTKTEAMKNYPRPTTSKELQRFLGMCNYYRRFIRNFAEIARPLHELTSKKLNKFEWNDIHERAFLDLKQVMISPPVLSFPSKLGKFILYTDASEFAIGGVLCQLQDGHERVIAYASRKLSDAEKRYGITKKEMLAVVCFVRQFKHYLWGVHFEIRCDHQALLSMLTSNTDSASQFYRWRAELDQYDFAIKFIKGAVNVLADAMSRISSIQPLMNVEENEMDEVTNVIIELLNQGKQRDRMPKEICSLNQSAKILWARRGELSVESNKLYLVTDKGYKRLVLPVSQQSSVVLDIHRQSGHVGIQKCLSILKQRFYWPKMEETVNMEINACELCNREKNKFPRDKAPLSGTLTGQPFDRIAIDITGPMNYTAKGNKYVLGIIDHFSKFCSLIPIRDSTAKTVAEALMTHWISIFGAPLEIISDNGSSFKNDLKSHLCLMMGIKEVFSLPYYPQANGLVERLFGTAKSMMKLIVVRSSFSVST